LFAHRYPAEFDSLLRLLADVSAQYLIRQLDCGADAVQIFDSWSSVLDEGMFDRACIRPVGRMVKTIKAAKPDAKIIGFPKGSSALLRGYREKTGVDAVGLDWAMPDWLAQEIQMSGPVQGNMDPLRVVAGGKALEDGVAHVLKTLGQGPLIFNLGHGVTPDTSPDHVARMVELVRRG
jgi:uroporphyrinogen decarboxylase